MGPWIQYSSVVPSCYNSFLDSSKSTCSFQVEDLKPFTVYELKLTGQSTTGFSETQRILFRTSSLNGASGKVLNLPEMLRLTGSGRTNQYHNTIIICDLFYFLLIYAII